MASAQIAPAGSSALPRRSGRRIVAHFIDVLLAFAVMLAAASFLRWLRALGVWMVQSLPAENQILPRLARAEGWRQSRSHYRLHRFGGPDLLGAVEGFGMAGKLRETTPLISM
jgi:hypothetical protein